MEPNQSAVEFVEVFRGLSDANIEIARMTIISTYEKAINSTNKPSEVLEFFRHIRNAAAHDCHFRFTPKVINNETGELKKKARWKKFEIKANMNGNKFLTSRKDDSKSFWRLGDLVEFLLDFQNYHPEVSKKH